MVSGIYVSSLKKTTAAAIIAVPLAGVEGMPANADMLASIHISCKSKQNSVFIIKTTVFHHSRSKPRLFLIPDAARSLNPQRMNISGALI